MAAVEAEKIVADQARQFMNWFENLQSVPTLRKIRTQIQSITDAELDNAKRRLLKGDDPEMVLQQFAHALSKKYMHNPTESLRQSHNESLLMAAHALFGLDIDQQK